MVKGPIYKEENTIGDIYLLAQLKDAIRELEEKMTASMPISKGSIRVGFGVNKIQRSIAADSVISIVKAIKILKGW